MGLALDLKSVFASWADHIVLSLSLGKPEYRLAFGAFAINVRFSVAHAQIKTAEGAEKHTEEAARRLVFFLPFVDVARHQAEERIREGAQIQQGEEDAADGIVEKDGI